MQNIIMSSSQNEVLNQVGFYDVSQAQTIDEYIQQYVSPVGRPL